MPRAPMPVLLAIACVAAICACGAAPEPGALPLPSDALLDGWEPLATCDVWPDGGSGAVRLLEPGETSPPLRVRVHASDDDPPRHAAEVTLLVAESDRELYLEAERQKKDVLLSIKVFLPDPGRTTLPGRSVLRRMVALSSRPERVHLRIATWQDHADYVVPPPWLDLGSFAVPR